MIRVVEVISPNGGKGWFIPNVNEQHYHNAEACIQNSMYYLGRQDITKYPRLSHYEIVERKEINAVTVTFYLKLVLHKPPSNLEWFYATHRGRIDTLHCKRHLRFKCLKPPKQRVKIYESGGHKGRRGSSYYLAYVEGKVVYLRRSDHWGRFCTRDLNEEITHTFDWKLRGGKCNGTFEWGMLKI